MPDVAVSRQDGPGNGNEQADRKFGDGIGVAARGAQYRHAGRRGLTDGDVVGVAPGGGHGDEGQLEDRPVDEVSLHHCDVGILVG